MQGRSRLDNWNSSIAISTHRSKSVHQPLHIHAHSTIDNWQTKKQTLRRAKSLPSVPDPIYIEPQSRIDTWQKRPMRSVSTASFVRWLQIIVLRHSSFLWHRSLTNLSMWLVVLKLILGQPHQVNEMSIALFNNQRRLRQRRKHGWIHGYQQPISLGKVQWRYVLISLVLIFIKHLLVIQLDSA